MLNSILNSVLVGDANLVLGQIEDGSVHLTVFSPPYDAVRSYNGEWALDYRKLGQELFRITALGGVCAVVIGDGTKDFAKSLTTFRWAIDWVDNARWRLFETCIYSRHGNPGAWWSQRFRVDHEYILIFFKGERPRVFDKESLMIETKHPGRVFSGTDRLTDGGLVRITPKEVNPTKCRGTIWPYASSNTEGNRMKLQHPATFPDLLAEDIIRCFSAKGDVVLDPMCGSGTSCVVASRIGRSFVGIDINSDYVAIAKERLASEIS